MTDSDKLDIKKLDFIDYSNKKFYYAILLVVFLLVCFSTYKLFEIKKHNDRVVECQEHLDSYKDNINFYCCYYCKEVYNYLGEYKDVGCYCNGVYQQSFDEEYFGKEVQRKDQT